jgi:hypothetical protein
MNVIVLLLHSVFLESEVGCNFIFHVEEKKRIRVFVSKAPGVIFGSDRRVKKMS